MLAVSNYPIPSIDLPEALRLCGITTCPDCVPHTGTMRADIDHEDVKMRAIAVALVSTKAAAHEVLGVADMDMTHIHSDCPYTGFIANMDMSSFPADRLHLQYVSCNL